MGPGERGMRVAPPDGWIPLYLTDTSEGPRVHWAYMGACRFSEPFFWDTASRLARLPINQLCRPSSSMRELMDRAEVRPGLPLAGLIFHMSRCGSTLAARALAALPDSVVLSEPGPLDSLLRRLERDPTLPLVTRLAWLRALVAALGQARRATDRRLFIKLDAWHMGWFDLLRAAFPDSPWVFIHREPVEVLVSQRRRAGLTVLPGHVPDSLLGPIPPGLPAGLPMTQGMRVLGMILDRAGQALATDDRGLALDYRDLPTALWTTLAAHFRLPLDAGHEAALRAACGQDAKRPERAFLGDTEEKQAEADAELRRQADRWLYPGYRAVTALRGGRARDRR